MPDAGAALKLKGVGHRADDEHVRPPTAEPYYRPNPHLGVSEDGELTIVESEPSPLGGMLLSRARAEFEVAESLQRRGVAAIVPVKVYRYAGLKFSVGDAALPMGAVLTLAPAVAGHRADVLLRLEAELSQEERVFVERLLLPAAGPTRSAGLLERFALLAGSYGAALRGFADAGFYRHSGSPDNWALDAGGERVYLTDLDSSRPLSECSRVRAPLEVMRDVAGGLFNIAAAILEPRAAPRLPADLVRRVDPFSAFLAGYFDEVPRTAVAAMGGRFLRYVLALLGEQRRRLRAAAAGDAFRRVWMCRRQASSLALVVTFELFANSGLRETKGLPFSLPDLNERLERFARQDGL
jgi:hypothetical protein